MTKEEIRQFFDSIAGKLGSRKKKNIYHRVLEALILFLVPEGQAVLELGSGTGDLLSAPKPSRGVGIDFSGKMTEVARRKYPTLTFHCMDAESLELDGKFDYIVASDLIGYLSDVQKVFAGICKLSYRKTRFVITYYNNWWAPILKFAELVGLRRPKRPIQNWLSLSDIQNLLYLAGWDTIKRGKKLLFPVSIPVVSSILNRYVANLPLVNSLCLIEYLVARPLVYQSRTFSCSIVVPCRNEKGNIEEIAKRIPQIAALTEIILVEGHSRDGTLEEIKRVAEEYKETRSIKWTVQNSEGKGDAVRKGFEVANGDILMVLDADMSVPPEELPKFYEALVLGKGEYLQGTRLIYPLEKRAMKFLNRMGNEFFSLWLSWILGQRVTDTLCGTKVLFREDYEKIRKGRTFWGEFDPFGDFDLLLGASKQNLKILEIPIRYQERKYGTTNIRRFYHGWLLLKMCVFATRKIISSS